MLRFKPEALNGSGRQTARGFNLPDFEDCFSDDLEPTRSGPASSQAHQKIPAKQVTLMEAEQGVKAALFNKLLVEEVVFDERYFYGQTALFLAAEYDSAEALELLKSAGADLEAEDMFGETALFLAVARGATQSVQWLVANGADVNHKTPEGETALHIAAMTSSESVEILVSAGADVNAPKTRGVTPLMMAAVNCSKAVDCLIRHGADVNSRSIFGDTALIYAVRSGNIDTTKLLVELVNDINYGGKSNVGYEFASVRLDSPLVMAVEGGNSELVRLLLEKGADANCRGIHSDTHVLHLSVGGPINHPLESTALNFSTPSNTRKLLNTSRSVVSCLLEHGACVDSRDKFGHTPLMIATKTGDVDSMETLITAGASLNATNSTGCTALYVAVVRKDIKSVKLLMTHGAVAGFELQQAVLLDKRIVETLLDNGAGPQLLHCRRLHQERGVSHPVSPLYVALRYGILDIADFFISRGFLTLWDIKEIPRDFKIIQLLNEFKYYKGGVPASLSALFAIHDLQSPVTCSLFLWSFVSVSEYMGFGPDREAKVKASGLPVPLQRRLLFQKVTDTPEVQDQGS